MPDDNQPAAAQPEPAPAQQPAAVARQSRFSKLSLITLILGFLWIPWPLTIFCGHIARGRIRRSKGALTGKGVALFGLLLGYLGMFAAIAVMIWGGLWAWRTTSEIRADIAAGRDPTATIMSRFGGPIVETILKNENLLPDGVRQQLDTALDQSADQRLQLVGNWMLQHAKAAGGRFPDSTGEIGKNLPAAATAKPASTAAGADSDPMSQMLSQANNGPIVAILARGFVVVPNLNTGMPGHTVILHAAKARPDGTVPAFLLDGTTVQLQPGDPRVWQLKLDTTTPKP